MATKTEDLLQILDGGVKSLCKSAEWTNYLDFVSRFPRYSGRNTMLIYFQRPDATMVQGMKAWNKLGGRVRKGSHAIRIFAPSVKKEKDDETGEEKEFVTGYHTACVFDVSDVEGAKIPDDPCHVLTDNVNNFNSLLKTLMSIADCPVTFGPISGSAKGYFNPADNSIKIREGLPEAQTVKTLIHEIAHSMLHGKGGKEENADARTREAEAESIAYVVSSRLGLDTGSYSFAYIAEWEGQADLIQEHACIIADTADEICKKLSCAMTNQGHPLPRDFSEFPL